jgi:hypothetical protein
MQTVPKGSNGTTSKNSSGRTLLTFRAAGEAQISDNEKAETEIQN